MLSYLAPTSDISLDDPNDDVSLSGMDIEQCKPVGLMTLGMSKALDDTRDDDLIIMEPMNGSLIDMEDEPVICGGDTKEDPIRSVSLLDIKHEPITSGSLIDTKGKPTTDVSLIDTNDDLITSGSLIDVNVDKQLRSASLIDIKESEPIKYTGMQVTGLLDDVWNPMVPPESDAPKHQSNNQK